MSTKQTLTDLKDRQNWWNELSDDWKKAFNEAMLQKGPVTDMPDEAGFEWILESPNFRFAGPRAFYPNMSFNLKDLSGLAMMHQAELISVTFHEVTNIAPIESLVGLKSLFLNDNQLTTLKGVEQMSQLVTLVFNNNHVDSLQPVSGLKQLKSLQAGINKLDSFEGLHKGNTKNLDQFVGLPNRVAQNEIDRLQNDLRVRVGKV